MSKRPDGGPAFPVEPQGAWLPDCDDPNAAPMREFPGHPGMSLRDYFAAQAMTGLIYHNAFALYNQGNATQTAKQAYAAADAMLEERDKWSPLP